MNTTKRAVNSSTNIKRSGGEKFYNFKYDRVFKTIFIDNVGNDYHLLDALLSECLGKKIKVLDVIYSELKVRSALERTKRLDCIVELDGKKLNIELNGRVDELIKIRNLSFFNSFQSQYTKAGEVYNLDTKFIQINLNYGMGVNFPEKLDYVLYDKNYGIEYTNNYEILDINIDKYAKKWYDDDIEAISKNPLLSMLGLDKEEMLKYEEVVANKNVSEAIDQVMNLNKKEYFKQLLSDEEEATIMANTQIMMAKNEGKAEGSNENKIETAKTMLSKNYKLEEISDITKLSIEEIKCIQES